MNIYSMLIFLASTSVVPMQGGSLDKIHQQPNHFETSVMGLPSGERINVRLAITGPQKKMGLSNLQKGALNDDDGLLIVFGNDVKRKLWMMNTQFDIDAFFLDKNFKVVAVERDMKAHPGKEASPDVYVSDEIVCRYILEMDATSQIAEQIQEGMTLQWLSAPDLEEILSKYARVKQ